jgi:B9 domain-containing protein 1
MVICIYGIDDFGRDVVRGYGSLRIPLNEGKHTLYIPTFVPIATSPLNGFLSVFVVYRKYEYLATKIISHKQWLAGKSPEFLDSSFVSHNKGREVTRVHSQGTVKVVVNIATKDMDRFGLQTLPKAA